MPSRRRHPQIRTPSRSLPSSNKDTAAAGMRTPDTEQAQTPSHPLLRFRHRTRRSPLTSISTADNHSATRFSDPFNRFLGFCAQIDNTDLENQARSTSAIARKN
ncbi:homeodomain-like superfamily protein [Striga asiatica]|uniref:Homeodomain-like superfamily protein n=1 Tax=Striga asiatica TaxID=4170 RepID=A0A5A7PKS7_STRAF|nr:homeodomain-like superfamily protein [Striga asiatica]